MNKKLVVPFLSTIIGLSIAGGLGGAFAWYQFNSEVTTSFIGTSVADGGLLQIGHDDGSGGIDWGRDYVKPNTNLIPVTFGQLITKSGKANCLNDNAFGRPEAGKQGNDGYAHGWDVIQEGAGYYQYNVYFRALEADSSAAGDTDHDIAPGYKQVIKPVYLSDVHIEGVGEDTTNPAAKTVSDAVRIHLDVDETGGVNRLIAKKEYKDENAVKLYGKLDLDGDGHNDVHGGYAWNDHEHEIVYGIDGETQTTTKASDIIQTVDEYGNMPESTIDDRNAKAIFHTKVGVSGYEAVKVTVTVWLEGWHLLNVDATDSSKKSNIWNPALNAGLNVRVGMTFATGKNF